MSSAEGEVLPARPRRRYAARYFILDVCGSVSASSWKEGEYAIAIAMAWAGRTVGVVWKELENQSI
jgi:hypothetical protein